MNLMIYFFILVLILMMILMVVLNLVSKKTFSDKEKNSPFECGFDPKTSSRMPFSLQFFLIAIIFLIFDVEIALILPVIKVMMFSYSFIMMLTINIFLILLILGLIHEWNQGALKWLK